MNVVPLIDRKELATLAQTSVDVIRKNEARLGLNGCRISINERSVRYKRKAALAVLRRYGLVQF